METTRLGKTGLVVTRSAFGALPVQRLELEDGARLLRRAYDLGINFFDTARAYSDSEAKIALGLGDVRHNVVIATKTAAATPEQFWKDLETSLKTLKTDYIDLYQLHNIAAVYGEDSEMYNCLRTAKEKGMVRHIGVTAHLLHLAKDSLATGLYETIQFPLSALSTQDEIQFAKDCGEADVGFIAMKALCGGLLNSAALSMAYLRPLKHVVPIWGFQRDSELDEVIELEKNPPALDEAMMARIQKERQELGGDFCRGCGYCMPCAVGLRINWLARFPQLLRRAPFEQFYRGEWLGEVAKIDQCADCGLCMSRCPYQLEIPRLLRAAKEDWEALGKEKGVL